MSNHNSIYLLLCIYMNYKKGVCNDPEKKQADRSNNHPTFSTVQIIFIFKFFIGQKVSISFFKILRKLKLIQSWIYLKNHLILGTIPSSSSGVLTPTASNTIYVRSSGNILLLSTSSTISRSLRSIFSLILLSVSL